MKNHHKLTSFFYPTQLHQRGFSLVELMIATVIGLLLSYAVMEVYIAQIQVHRTTNSQDLIQSTENAIANLVTPIIRSAGFMGCSTISTAISTLNGGGSNPIGSINTNPTLVAGYNGSASGWIPSLDPALTGNVKNNSDVLVVLGATLGSFPVSITTIDSSSSSFTVQSTNGLNLAVGQFAAVSDCVKPTIFQITGATETTISHTASSGEYGNASSFFVVNYQPGAQFIPLQQTAFFVGQEQSALMRGILTQTGWSIEPLVPGVELMKIEYGIGGSGTISQYVTADAVSNWAQIYAIRIGFLIAGQIASGNSSTQYSVLGTTVTVPNDNRLRHVYEINIDLRNARS